VPNQDAARRQNLQYCLGVFADVLVQVAAVNEREIHRLIYNLCPVNRGRVLKDLGDLALITEGPLRDGRLLDHMRVARLGRPFPSRLWREVDSEDPASF